MPEVQLALPSPPQSPALRDDSADLQQLQTYCRQQRQKAAQRERAERTLLQLQFTEASARLSLLNAERSRWPKIEKVWLGFAVEYTAYTVSVAFGKHTDRRALWVCARVSLRVRARVLMAGALQPPVPAHAHPHAHAHAHTHTRTLRGDHTHDKQGGRRCTSCGVLSGTGVPTGAQHTRRTGGHVGAARCRTRGPRVAFSVMQLPSNVVAAQKAWRKNLKLLTIDEGLFREKVVHEEALGWTKFGRVVFWASDVITRRDTARLKMSQKEQRLREMLALKEEQMRVYYAKQAACAEERLSLSVEERSARVDVVAEQV